MHEKIKNLIQRSLVSFGVPKDFLDIQVEHTSDFDFGDYSTNVAMILVKSLGATAKSPYDLAEKIVKKIQEELSLTKSEMFEKVQAVQPGFINFHLSRNTFSENIAEINEKKVWYGKNTKLWNKKFIIEHTNLNPFKPFHIGHLVNNAVGESISRLYEFQDAKITRASYGGDVGLHVAKAVWGMLELKNDTPYEGSPFQRVEFLGKAYALGSEKYESDSNAQEKIKEINKKIFQKSDPEINEAYDWGREASLKYFQDVYSRLNSRFDYHFYESEVAEEGKMIVETYLERGVFLKSEGAIIFPGEKFGLHNRVFITSEGLPTYEAKELGLTKKKFELHDFDYSIVVTANEQDDYFKVVLKAIEQIYPEVASRTMHISHGMLRFSTGKMSSRKGNVITGESLLQEVYNMVIEKMKERDMTEAEQKEIAEHVSLAAIKYSILRQSIGKDIIFDPEKSISFEGDSGPYLQYAYVRARSILAKAHDEKISSDSKARAEKSDVSLVERLLLRFPEIVERSAVEYSPSSIATYLIQLAGEYNSYYAKNKIVDAKDPESPYRIALTEAVSWVIKNGLHLLGIKAPEKM
jgi:arginyl-tRNA synthetase